MRLFQMTYMTPSRRALYPGLPSGPAATSHRVNASPAAFSAGLSTLRPQSNARPSLCSLWPPTRQSRLIPDERPTFQ
jgi:hypothetical protein